MTGTLSTLRHRTVSSLSPMLRLFTTRSILEIPQFRRFSGTSSLFRPVDFLRIRRVSLPLTSLVSLPALSRGFKTRTTTGVGRRHAQPSADDETDSGDDVSTTYRRRNNLAPSSVSSASPSSKSEDPEEREKIDVESALRQKRKSISRILKKYKRKPEVQQQIKIAFADGYAYAEQKNSSGSGGNRRSRKGPASMLSRAGDVIWWCIGLWFFYYIVNDIRNAFGGDGFSGMPGHGLFNSMEPYEVNPEEILVNFSDVKGVDEAKDELVDVVEFLRDPDRFSALGGSMPHGVLLVGEPGVGKTLLAKAVAGEAGVPFFHAAGSEFDEVFVGTGAKRVRQLFASAKHRAPAVIFIDEIDSVGGKRTSSPGHPYANQTINMLLAEMDGFDKNEGVVVIGATNKRDNLDKALIRPGRFDVEVRVYPPDLKARKELFDLYLSRVSCDEEVDADALARDTRGFVGADIDNMVNQAAIRAAQQNATAVGMVHLDWARDKVSMGPEKKSKIPDAKVNWNTALHEAGHALVAHLTPGALPIRKVTIVPRGPALGYVEQTPKDVMTNQSKAELLASMDVALGGKIAEELEHNSADVTTGCSSDLEKATATARSMVLQYGMGEAMGKRVVNSDEDFDALSNRTKTAIDLEVKVLVDDAYGRAERLLKKHKKEHLRLANALYKYETLDADDVRAILRNEPLKKRSEAKEVDGRGVPMPLPAA